MIQTTTRTVQQIRDNPPPIDRFEILAGEVVEMSRSSRLHGKVVFKLAHLVLMWMETHRIGGQVSGAESSFWLTEHDEFCPDFAWTPDSEADMTRGRTKAWPLMVEVLSPSNSESDMAYKVEVYLKTGAQEVWLIDPESQRWIIHRADGKPFDVAGDYTPGEWMPGFSLAKTDLLVPSARP